jgi:hypothetical protein
VAAAPGDIVAMDQMVLPKPGLVAQMKGFITGQRYTGAKIFVDHFSNLSFVYLQKGLTIVETLEAKAAFERYASAHGVTIRHYQTNNGIFETDSFRRSVEMAGQTISYAGVNAHHQNGHAEGKIRDLQAMGRAMLLHAAHRWPAAITANLWPYAVRMANDSINSGWHQPVADGTVHPGGRGTARQALAHVRMPSICLGRDLANGRWADRKMERAIEGRVVSRSIPSTFETSGAGIEPPDRARVTAVSHCI